VEILQSSEPALNPFKARSAPRLGTSERFILSGQSITPLVFLESKTACSAVFVIGPSKPTRSVRSRPKQEAYGRRIERLSFVPAYLVWQIVIDLFLVCRAAQR
jgi:hypothetical protein